MWLAVLKTWLMVILLGWREAGLTLFLLHRRKVCCSSSAVEQTPSCLTIAAIRLCICLNKLINFIVLMTPGIGKGVCVCVCARVRDVSLLYAQDSSSINWCGPSAGHYVLCTLFRLLQLKFFHSQQDHLSERSSMLVSTAGHGPSPVLE